MAVEEFVNDLQCLECKGHLSWAGDRVVCNSCSKSYPVVNGIPRLISDNLEKFAEEIAVQDAVACGYEEQRYRNPYARAYHAWWTQQMVDRVHFSGKVLDNGCGTGILFATLQNNDAQVIGLDISSEMLKYAKKHADHLLLGNSEQLPFKDSTFDVVFCRSLLHHLPNPQKAVDEIKRVLKPGKDVVFVDTNKSLISTLPRMIANTTDHFSEDHKNLDRRTIEGFLRSDFRVDDVMYFGYLAYPLFGFPDLMNLSRFVPFKRVFAPFLFWLDRVLAKIPGIRTQSFGVLVKATNVKAR